MERAAMYNFRNLRAFAPLLLCLAATPLRAAPPPVEAYGRLPAIEELELSPSGDRFAFIATDGNKRRLYVREVDGDKTLLTLVDVGTVKVRDLDWAGENFIAITISDRYNLGMWYGGAYELAQVMVLDVANRQLKPLLKDSRFLGSVNGRYGYTQRDGRWVGFFSAPLMSNSTGLSGERTLLDGDPDLVSVDLESGGFRRLAESSSGNGAGWLVGRDGTVLATARYEDKSADWRLYAGTMSGKLIEKRKDTLGENWIIGQGRTAGTVLYAVHDEQGATHYMEASLATGEKKEILTGDPVRSFKFDPVTGLLTGTLREGDNPELVMFDPKQQALLDATRRAFPQLQVGFESWSDDFKRLVVKTEGPGDAGSWWLVDARTAGKPAKADYLGEQYPSVKPEQVGPFKMIDYKAADGTKLQGVLTLPPGREPKKLPLVVLPHGGPQARDYPSFDFWAQAYASRGYAVWQPNFRGSAGYGVDLVNAGHGEFGRKMQTDISDGVAELARQGIIDPQRACIVGASYGGYAALAGVTLQQGLYRCAVAVAGVTDLKDFLTERRTRLGADGMRYWMQYLGAKNTGDDLLETLSPARLAARADAPVLLIHGKDDTIVPIRQSQLMKRAMEKANKPVEMITLNGEDHYLSREATRIDMLRAAVAFVEKHNPAEAGTQVAPEAQAAAD